MKITQCVACGLVLPSDALVCPHDGTSVLQEKTATRIDPLVGAMLGDYRVQERIGLGGMGIVYKAVQPQISKQVAIKVLRPDIAGDPTHRRSTAACAAQRRVAARS